MAEFQGVSVIYVIIPGKVTRSNSDENFLILSQVLFASLGDCARTKLIEVSKILISYVVEFSCDKPVILHAIRKAKKQRMK